MKKTDIASLTKAIKNLKSEAGIMKAMGERLVATATRIESEADALLGVVGEQPGGGRKAKIELTPEQKLELRHGNRLRPSA